MRAPDLFSQYHSLHKSLFHLFLVTFLKSSNIFNTSFYWKLLNLLCFLMFISELYFVIHFCMQKCWQHCRQSSSWKETTDSFLLFCELSLSLSLSNIQAFSSIFCPLFETNGHAVTDLLTITELLRTWNCKQVLSLCSPLEYVSQSSKDF